MESVETEVTELCRALPFMEGDDMLGLLDPRVEIDCGKKCWGVLKVASC